MGWDSAKLNTNPPQQNKGRRFTTHVPSTCKRVHILSNSLFKVLFNFPSRYLFAIGLVPVFSLRWNLPPTLGCILKQPDSGEHPSNNAARHMGLAPAMGKSLNQENLDRPCNRMGTPIPHIATLVIGSGASGLGFSRFTRRYSEIGRAHV